MTCSGKSHFNPASCEILKNTGGDICPKKCVPALSTCANDLLGPHLVLGEDVRQLGITKKRRHFRVGCRETLLRKKNEETGEESGRHLV